MDIRLNVGMLSATCALCAVEVGVKLPVYENLVTTLICVNCATGRVYVGYKNAHAFVVKTKGPLKQVRKTL